MAVREKRLSAEEFFELEKDMQTPAELFDGNIVALASPSRSHNRLLGRLYSVFDSYVRSGGGSCSVDMDIDVRLDDENVVRPDLMIVCDPSKLDELRCYGAPDMVVEIISTNRDDDFFRKLYMYRRAGVREYWIVDIKNSRTVVYDFGTGEIPEIFTFDRDIPVGIYSGGISINISELFD